MPKPALSVCLDDLKLETKPALEQARALGFRAIDVSATAGPISPAELSHSGQRHLIKHLSNLGLRLGSLRGPAGGSSYADPITGERRLDSALRIIELAAALRVPVISTSVGQQPGSSDPVSANRLHEALVILADRADQAGVTIAIETADIEAAELNRLLHKINCPSLAACCDSGAMLMRGEDPHAIAQSLPGRIRLARARDAVAGSPQHAGYEVALGQGRLDTVRFLAALDEAGLSGDIVLTRTTGTQPSEDLRNTREHFEKYIA